MIDYTNKESLKQFLAENGIRDTVQLNTLFRQRTDLHKCQKPTVSTF